MAVVVENFDFGQRLILLHKMGFTSNNDHPSADQCILTFLEI